MATVTPEELLALWVREGISSEMAIGHIIQNLVQQQTAIGSLQSSLAALRAAASAASTPAPAGQRDPDKRGSPRKG